jgi:hypothetical protein
MKIELKKETKLEPAGESVFYWVMIDESYTGFSKCFGEERKEDAYKYYFECIQYYKRHGHLEPIIEILESQEIAPLTKN